MSFAPEGVVRYIDLFCGIGGFRLALEDAASANRLTPRCVLSSDINKSCREVYTANFNETPGGDITQVSADSVPDHDVLLAGFPCQPFSIMGMQKGFQDTRGTLFFEIARILEAKRPPLIVLENVRMLKNHDNGRTLAKIMEVLKGLGYHADHRVLNALDFGLPQKRDRIWIVGFLEKADMVWPSGGKKRAALSEILEADAPKKYYASEKIRANRLRDVKKTVTPGIWHENKSGNISVKPYSCALRAGASHNYLLVNGERRLTPRELLRLQGFPEWFKPAEKYHHMKAQAGNSLPVNVARAVINAAFCAVMKSAVTNG
jgi:DNA (cytosine-5)-methyltransferase 1